MLTGGSKSSFSGGGMRGGGHERGREGGPVARWGLGARDRPAQKSKRVPPKDLTYCISSRRLSKLFIYSLFSSLFSSVSFFSSFFLKETLLRCRIHSRLM